MITVTMVMIPIYVRFFHIKNSVSSCFNLLLFFFVVCVCVFFCAKYIMCVCLPLIQIMQFQSSRGSLTPMTQLSWNSFPCWTLSDSPVTSAPYSVGTYTSIPCGSSLFISHFNFSSLVGGLLFCSILLY